MQSQDRAAVTGSIDPVDRRRAVTRTALAGAISNLLLSALKVGVGWVGNSHALVADGIHSLSDLASDVLVWVAGHHASRGPDEEHPYGHARYETMATLALGLLLFLVALGLGWDAVERLFAPEDLAQPAWITLYAAALSIFVKEWLYWYTRAYAIRVKSDMLRANAWHHRSDAISSVVVLVGVAGTLAGLPYLDAVAACIVAAMIAKIAWDLGMDAVRELVDTGLEPERLAAVRETILNVGGVRDIHLLRTRTLGGTASTDVHVLVDPYISVSEGHMISVQVERELKRKIDEISDVTVHIDSEDDSSTAPTQDLPGRRAALARLAALWSDVPGLASRERVQLHYLGGRIQVEVFLPGSDAQQARSADALYERALEALSKDAVFGDLRIYYGGAPDNGA